jgi:hypothetical protein
MKQIFTVHLTPDFYILCELFSFTPEEVLQYYINHISLSVFEDESAEELLLTATYFFGKYSPSKGKGKTLKRYNWAR